MQNNEKRKFLLNLIKEKTNGNEFTVMDLFMHLQKYFVEKKPKEKNGKLVFVDVPVSIPFSTFRYSIGVMMKKNEIDFRTVKNKLKYGTNKPIYLLKNKIQ